MRRAQYTDRKGRVHVVELPDGKPDSEAAMGIPIGPPPLEALGLPQEIEVRLHNQLAARGILTAADAKRGRKDIFAALQKALAVDITRIVEICYNASKGVDT